MLDRANRVARRFAGRNGPLCSRDDLRQAGAEAVYDDIHRFPERDRSQFGRWAYMTARRGAFRYIRRVRHFWDSDEPLDNLVISECDGPEDPELRRRWLDRHTRSDEGAIDAHLDAHRLLGHRRLTDAERETLRLFYLEHVPTSEIAARYGISENTVYTRLSSARRKLRR